MHHESWHSICKRPFGDWVTKQSGSNNHYTQAAQPAHVQKKRSEKQIGYKTTKIIEMQHGISPRVLGVNLMHWCSKWNGLGGKKQNVWEPLHKHVWIWRKKILRISQLVTFILAMEQQDKRECVNCVDVIVLNVGNKWLVMQCTFVDENCIWTHTQHGYTYFMAGNHRMN